MFMCFEQTQIALGGKSKALAWKGMNPKFLSASVSQAQSEPLFLTTHFLPWVLAFAFPSCCSRGHGAQASPVLACLLHCHPTPLPSISVASITVRGVCTARMLTLAHRYPHGWSCTANVPYWGSSCSALSREGVHTHVCQSTGACFSPRVMN